MSKNHPSPLPAEGNRAAAAKDPVYFQTTEFTCGPASLMTAMAALDPAYKPGRLEEMTIWREANLVFMGEDPAGCGPFGLANAAIARGFDAELYGHKIDALFAGWTRTPGEAEVQQMMHDRDRATFLQGGGKLTGEELNPALLTRLHAEKKQLLVLVTAGLHGHWVVANRLEDDQVEILDPYKAEPDDTNPHSLTGIRTLPDDAFARRSRYGEAGSTVIIAVSKAPQ
jgi:hypothetical protein